MSVFLNSQHELRSGWKFAVFVVVLLLAFAIFGIAASLVAVRTPIVESEIGLFALNAAVTLLASIAATLFTTRFIDHKGLAAFGMSLHKGWRRDFAIGMAMAAAMLLLTVAACAVLGSIDIRRSRMWSTGATAATLALLFQAAAFEEIVFRGYPMQVLMRGIGAWPAAVLMSVLFGIVHSNNPNASPLGIMNTVLAGIVLSAAFLKTRSLWLPYGIHLGWNAGLGMVFGFSLSGVDISSFWTTSVSGSELLVGGGYGPEGGIVGTIGFGSGLVLLMLWKARNHSEEI